MGRPKPADLLAPYLAGPPRDDGEQDLHCPLHHDSRRSATINFDRGVWWCAAGCPAGSIDDLVKRQDDWVAAPNGAKVRTSRKSPANLPSESEIKTMNSVLLSDESLYGALVGQRGITRDTMARYELGWDEMQLAITIPVRDADGQLINVRYYDPNPDRTRRKIWQVRGAQTTALYPIATLADQPEFIVICEGEWDTLLTLQQGIPAITRTGSASTWLASWNPLFKGKVIYLAHDCDGPGQSANRKIGASLARWGSEVLTLQLPYAITEDHGKDLSDFWLEGRSADDFREMMRNAQPYDSAKANPETLDPSDATILDSFDSRRLGKPMRLTVTIKGKRDPGYSVPREVELKCSQDAGEKCQRCPLFGAGGQDTVEVEQGDPLVLEMMNSTKHQLAEIVRLKYGAVKCDRLEVVPVEHQAVEVLFARPSVEHMSGNKVDVHKSMKINSVGRHDTMPNNTVQVVGALYADPRTQLNEFMAWQISRMETSVDSFELTPGTVKLMKRFRPRRGQKPLKRIGDISRDLAAHVTKIYGRVHMHAMMDLTWHSVLSFEFDGKRLDRGWIEALIVGDTRTGKSEAATRLSQFYGAGEVVACENASLAGVVGGLQQFGQGSREWAITWGVVPLNDRRLVVLDEVSGLSTDEISQMSQMRSSGIAELNKIQQEATPARTRLIWLGNPRNARMRDFTFGVNAIRPLIGTNEDVARFDIAMTVSSDDVSTEEINRSHAVGEQEFTAEACQALVRWVWSRKVEDVIWDPAATAEVYRQAQLVGARYIDDPPLVLPADIRVKIARLSVAIAARLFSTTKDYEKVLVLPGHVRAAVTFLDSVYSAPGFGYAERSQERLSDDEEARAKADEVQQFLVGHPGLSKFLRSNSSFRRQDLEEVLNVQRETASAIISALWSARMVRKEGGDVRAEAALHDVLRRTK